MNTAGIRNPPLAVQRSGTPVSRVLKAEGIVLWKRPLRETDVIVGFYTRQYGKLRVVAKAARRPTCRFASAVEPFLHGSYTFYRKPTKELALMTQHAVISSFRALREDLDRFVRASYVIELLDKFTSWEAPQLALWQLVLRTLQGLEAQPARWRIWIAFFELRLLAVSGFQLRLHRCVRCEQSLLGFPAAFSIDRGGVTCDACAPFGDEEQSRWTLGAAELEILQALQAASFQDIASMVVQEKMVKTLRQSLLPFLHRFSETHEEFRTLTVARSLGSDTLS